MEAYSLRAPILILVASNKAGGKARINNVVSLIVGKIRYHKEILYMVTLRNLTLGDGTSLSYWSSYNTDHVAALNHSCVQGWFRENTCTSFQKENKNEQGPKYNRPIKTREVLTKTGSNRMLLFFFGAMCGRQSVRISMRKCEGTQVNLPFGKHCRGILTKIQAKQKKEAWVIPTEITQMVEKCKNKDGRFGKLIQIIGSTALLKIAYLMIKGNSANITLDGMRINTLERLSQDIISGKFKVLPVRRIFIKKKSKGELRPIGVADSREKIAQKAIEIVFSYIFEQEFLDSSHGFRVGRSCHSALKYLQLKIGNVSAYSWVVEGDIKGCFDNIAHNILLKKIKQKVDCVATIKLVEQILMAGYVLDADIKKVGKNAKVFKSDVGVPQGSVLSPLFCNIVLHELDKFVENSLKKDFTAGVTRKSNLEYRKARYKIRTVFDKKKRRKLINLALKINPKVIEDPKFKRIYYVRYADDWVILVAGSFSEAESIREKMREKLAELKLELNNEKTKITSLRKGKCEFLGFDFFIRELTKDNQKPISLLKTRPGTGENSSKTYSYRKRSSPRLILHAPIKKLLTKLQENQFVKRSSKGEFFPIGRPSCIPLSHPQILNYYNARIRGILNYYSCVHNRMSLWAIVRFLNYSCALTLARKYKLRTLAKTFKKFGRDLIFQNGEKKIYRIYQPDNLRMLSEKERFKAGEVLDIDKLLSQKWINSMTISQFDESCILCGTKNNVEIHHIKSVKNVRMRSRTYDQWVGGFYRKTLPLCNKHHVMLHANNLSAEEIKKLADYKGSMKSDPIIK